MDTLFEKLTDPQILVALGIAFVLGYMFRGGGQSSSLSPPPPTPEQIDEALKRVTRQQWNAIDDALQRRRKIEAIRLLRQATGLGLKVAKQSVEQRARERNLQ